MSSNRKKLLFPTLLIENNLHGGTMKKKWMVVGAIILVLLAIGAGVIIMLVRKEQNKVVSFEVANNVIQYTANSDGLYAVTTNGEMICYPIESTASYKLDKTDVIFSDMDREVLIKKNGDIYHNVTATGDGNYIGTIPGAVSCSTIYGIIAVLTDTGEFYVRYIDVEEEYKVKFRDTEIYDDWLKIKDFGKVKKVLVVEAGLYVLNMQGEYYECFYSEIPKKIEVEVNIADVFSNNQVCNYILDTEGNLYPSKGYLYWVNDHKSINFGNYLKVDYFQELTRVKIGLSEGLALSKENTLYAWALRFSTKGLGMHKAFIYDEIENFVCDDFFLGGHYIYSLKGTTMTRIPFPTKEK